jgi:flagellar biosynthesis/type III secretory pathway protein FliH
MLQLEPIRFSLVLRDIQLGAPEPAPVAASVHEAALAEAYQRGWEEAVARHELVLAEQRQEFARTQEDALKGIATQHEALVAQFTAALIPLSSQIAARVLAGVSPDAELVARVVAETLGELETGTPDVEVYLSPRDCELAEAIAAEQGQRFPGLRLMADRDLRPGDCRVQSRFGAIDGRLKTKLENVLGAL